MCILTTIMISAHSLISYPRCCSDRWLHGCSRHTNPPGINLTRQKVITPGKKIMLCCRDGTGKSGILLTAYSVIRGIEQNRCIDTFQTVKQLRNARKNMVPTVVSYKYSLLRLIWTRLFLASCPN